jgi:hypothetical protein
VNFKHNPRGIRYMRHWDINEIVDNGIKKDINTINSLFIQTLLLILRCNNEIETRS